MDISIQASKVNGIPRGRPGCNYKRCDKLLENPEKINVKSRLKILQSTARKIRNIADKNPYMYARCEKDVFGVTEF